jgi:hypothetical protein
MSRSSFPDVTMPGFSAEGSLRPAAGFYQSGRHRADAGTGLTVAAAAMRGFEGRTDGMKPGCDPSCLCVTPEGCNCCQSIPPEYIGWVRR